MSKLFTLSTLGTVFILRLNINTGHRVLGDGGGDQTVEELGRVCSLQSALALCLCILCNVQQGRVTPRIHTSSWIVATIGRRAPGSR